jgi:type III pantothenate kinase
VRVSREKVIVVDIGNTSTTVGVAVGRRILRTGRLPSSDGSDPKRIETLLRKLATPGSVSDAVLCSVVPRLDPCWRHVLNRYTGRAPLEVSHRIRLGVGVDYPHPETIGADRLANAVAAWIRYQGAVVVADFGTALTFDVITGDGRYVGGVIAPGLPLMTDYLCERTALLPNIKLTQVHRAIGRSTREAMRIGAMVGYRGMVREIFHEVVGDMQEPKVVFCATGGYAAQAVKGLDVKVDVLPNLTLDGLVAIRELNRQGA